MNKDLANKLSEVIETLMIEKIALKGLVVTLNPKWSIEKIDQLVDEAVNRPDLRRTVHGQLRPLRERLESDSDLEAAISEFLKASPPLEKMN